MRLGLHDRGVRGDVRGRVQLDLDGSLAEPRHGPEPEQGYVHEWLHQVEGFYRGLGLGADELPGLHEAGDSLGSRPAESRRSGTPTPSTTTGATGEPGRTPGLRGIRTG